MDEGSGIAASAWDEVAWPCHAFRVMVPVKQRGRLNLFEEVAMNLLRISPFEPASLADRLCLPADLVEFILLKLQDQGLLTDHYDLTEEAEDYLTKRDESPPSYEERVVFREMVGGQILPIFWKGDLFAESIVDWNELGSRIEKGTTGKPKSLKLRSIPIRNPARPVTPTVSEVLSTLEKYRRLSRMRSLLSGVEPSAPSIQSRQVEISSNAVAYWLRCQVMIPEGGTDFVIADPFGYGSSDLLENAYRKLVSENDREETHLLNLKDRAIDRTIGYSDHRESSSSLQVSHAYPELRGAMRNLDRRLQECMESADTSDRIADLSVKQQHLVRDLYSALEWGLRYCLDQTIDRSRLKLLESGSSETNGKFLEESARKIGFAERIPDRLLNVPPGRVRSFEYGSTEMQSLLAVGIVSACSNSFHPLRKVASEMPGWLHFIHKIKKARDPASHGESIDLTGEHLKTFYMGTLGTIHILLPDAVSGDAGIPKEAESQTHMKAEFEARMLARIALERFFGTQLFKHLSSNVSNLLIGVERLISELHDSGETDGKAAITDLAAALQSVIHQRVKELKTRTPIGQDDPLEYAAKRAREAGFLLEDERLPESISTVGRAKIERSIGGASQSLGASLVTLLILAPKEWLHQAAGRQKDYVRVVAQTVGLRLHGGCSVNLPVGELIYLKQEVYETIKTTTEI